MPHPWVTCCVPKVLSVLWGGWRRLTAPPPPSPSVPAWDRTSWRGAQGVFSPLSLSRLGGSSRRPARLAAFIDSFCSNEADGAELKTKNTQNNPKPREGWEEGGGEGRRIPVVGMLLQGGTAGPQRRGQASPPVAPGCEGGPGGGWAVEGRRSPGGCPREERCPQAERDGHWGCARTLTPGGVMALTPSLTPQQRPLPVSSLGTVHPRLPIPSSHGPSPTSPIPTGPCPQPGAGLGVQGAARVGCQDGEGDTHPWPSRWVW